MPCSVVGQHSQGGVSGPKASDKTMLHMKEVHQPNAAAGMHALLLIVAALHPVALSAVQAALCQACSMFVAAWVAVRLRPLACCT
jgi:hypothetical protein